jgi:hypothetical protein
MNIVILLVMLAAALYVIGFSLHQLASFIRGDGTTERSRARTAPRSHHVDQFEPRPRAA